MPKRRAALFWVGLLSVLMWWALSGTVASARAQAVVGATHEGVLPLGRNSHVSLPEGRWRITGQTKVPRPQAGGSEWEVLVLENMRPNAEMPALVIRHVPYPSRWGNTNCHSENSARGVIFNDTYGTTSNQLTNKCGRAYAIGTIDSWRTGPANQTTWWAEVNKLLLPSIASIPSSFLLLEMTVQRFNGRGLRVEAFVLPPAGQTSGQFRNAVLANNGGPPSEQLTGWMRQFVERMEATFLDERPSSLAQLPFPYEVRQMAGAAPPAVTPVAPPAGGAVQAQAPQQTPPQSPPAVPVEQSPPRQPPTEVAQVQTLAQSPTPNRPGQPPAAAAPSASRKALVIGNDTYTEVPALLNARADAQAIAQSLRVAGFQVFEHLNVNEKGFKQALRDFRAQLQGGDEAVFFFAGHGIQIGNTNFLLPVDIRGDNEEQVRDDAIQLQRVLDDMQERRVRFSLAVVDACRDNPFRTQTRAIGGRGLAPTQAATGQMIIFSAGSGQQALDRLGKNDLEKNSLFTRVLLREMLKPQVPIDRVLRNVRNEVVRLARTVGHEQTPALYDQAIGDFYIRP